MCPVLARAVLVRPFCAVAVSLRAVCQLRSNACAEDADALSSNSARRVLVSVQPHLEKREQTQQEVDEAIARMLEEEEARGKGGGGGGGGKGKRLSKISDEGGDELIAKMLQEEEEKAMREQQKRLAGGRPVAVH
eukprot:3291895-Rhodomonas_salina.2